MMMVLAPDGDSVLAMRDPAKLRVVGEARDLAVATYSATARFPDDEGFGLTAQMRRAGVSIGSNIVEGFHRAGNRAFVAFLFNGTRLGGGVAVPNRIGAATQFR